MSNIDDFERLWETASVDSRKRLLKAYGGHESFSKLDSIKEVANRGGGMVVGSMYRGVQLWRSRNPNRVIRF